MLHLPDCNIVSIIVALLAEGVDRNVYRRTLCIDLLIVALLAEGVDRNRLALPRSRRARVALLAEGVDRNRDRPKGSARSRGRPPRGGRG